MLAINRITRIVSLKDKESHDKRRRNLLKDDKLEQYAKEVQDRAKSLQMKVMNATQQIVTKLKIS